MRPPPWRTLLSWILNRFTLHAALDTLHRFAGHYREHRESTALAGWAFDNFGIEALTNADHNDDLFTPIPAAPSPLSSSTWSSASTVSSASLKAFISHKGPSVHSGHYVAHIRVDDTNWVLFNDEKVVKADAESVKELKKLAYLYIFEKA
ncbi:ubiquitin C-terminal hydrolase Ubp14 [Pleurotus ostreatus]|nr:ubiquitin C-terminal hydrolase Ubp14 [Pleurotus ostreatus]